MSRRISEKDIKKVEVCKAELGKAEEVIHNRIDYILNTVAKAFGGTIDNWYFEDACEGEVGDFTKYYYGFRTDKETMYVITEFYTIPGAMFIIDKDGDDFDFSGGEFYTRWLFEDFEDELHNGIKLYKEAQEQKKLKAEQKKLRNKQQKKEMKILAAEAKKKLSKAELKALLNK